MTVRALAQGGVAAPDRARFGRTVVVAALALGAYLAALDNSIVNAILPVVAAAFGTDLTGEEIVLARALSFLERRTGTAWDRLLTGAHALAAGSAAARHRGALMRMGLAQPRSASEWLQQRLVVLALEATSRAGAR